MASWRARDGAAGGQQDDGAHAVLCGVVGLEVEEEGAEHHEHEPDGGGDAERLQPQADEDADRAEHLEHADGQLQAGRDAKVLEGAGDRLRAAQLADAGAEEGEHEQRREDDGEDGHEVSPWSCGPQIRMRLRKRTVGPTVHSMKLFLY